MTQSTYTIRCTSCGKEWHYEQFTCYMQKINAFHCNCGGKLIVIRPEHDREETCEETCGPGSEETAERDSDQTLGTVTL